MCTVINQYPRPIICVHKMQFLYMFGTSVGNNMNYYWLTDKRGQTCVIVINFIYLDFRK